MSRQGRARSHPRIGNQHVWILVALAWWCCVQAAAEAEPEQGCEDLVAAYTRDHGQHFASNGTKPEFLFFLHVPRTAGKTYAQCFLRAAYPPSKRCAPSYDGLRLNVSIEDCSFLASHDDYSLTQQLPPGTAVITQLRNPVDRVVSMYEFAVEVAARRIHLDDEAFWEETRRHPYINTLNVWPWSKLVPWFRTDIRRRMAALKEEATGEGSLHPPVWDEVFDEGHNRTYFWKKATKESVWEKPAANATLDPFDNPLVMPLAEWIETDIARDFAHDGAVLQVLGLTNYSLWGGHGALRRCFFTDYAARNALWTLASKRVQAMAHVGLTEQLEESVLLMAAELGHTMASAAYKTTTRDAFSYDGPDFDPGVNVTYNSTADSPPGQNVTLNVLEARRKLAHLGREMKQVDAKLKPLQAELQGLVDKEDAWVEREDERKEAAAATLAGRAAALLKGLFARARGGARNATALMSKNITSNSTDAKKEAAADEDIDSPWAAEILALDDRVYALQQRSEALHRDVDALTALPLVRGVSSLEPKGRARQVLPDPLHLEPTSLGETYVKCSANATARAASKRQAAFKHLRTPWEESFGFSSAARKQIAPSTIARIAELNSADQALWELGKHLLTQRLHEQAAAGRLEAMPAPKAPAPAPAPATRDREAAAFPRRRQPQPAVSHKTPPTAIEGGEVGAQSAARDEL